jgi:hypothetical protein
MLARLYVALPFHILLPEGEQYPLPTYIDEAGLAVTFDLPIRTERLIGADLPEAIRIDDKPGFVADALQITFKRDAFDRQVASEPDPSFEAMNRALRFLLQRLKFVARAPQIKPLEIPFCQWRLRYLQDDGSELDEQHGLIRGRAATRFSFSAVPLYLVGPAKFRFRFSRDYTKAVAA